MATASYKEGSYSFNSLQMIDICHKVVHTGLGALHCFFRNVNGLHFVEGSWRSSAHSLTNIFCAAFKSSSQNRCLRFESSQLMDNVGLFSLSKAINLALSASFGLLSS